MATPVRDVQPGGCSRKRGGWLLQYETYSQAVPVEKRGGWLLQYDMCSQMVAVESGEGNFSTERTAGSVKKGKHTTNKRSIQLKTSLQQLELRTK